MLIHCIDPSQRLTCGSIRKPELHAKNACIRKTVIASATIRVVVGSVAFEKQVRKEYRLQKLFRTFQDVIVPEGPAVRCSTYRQAL